MKIIIPSIMFQGVLLYYTQKSNNYIILPLVLLLRSKKAILADCVFNFVRTWR